MISTDKLNCINSFPSKSYIIMCGGEYGIHGLLDSIVYIVLLLQILPGQTESAIVQVASCTMHIANTLDTTINAIRR